MSVTAPAGFRAAAVAAGIKSGGLDLALLATEDGRPVPAAAVFTSNKAAAAPVRVSREHIARSGGKAAGVVINSGNANAATGAEGHATAEATAALLARHLGARPEEVLVCSTGIIGVPLARELLHAGVESAVRAMRGGAEAAHEAAEAIMTTDTRVKEVVVRADGFSVGGMAKGAAMLAPDMATMLAVLTTDAVARPEDLKAVLRPAVATSFNSITVDGCTSTNDTVVLLASGRAGAPGRAALAAAMEQACTDLGAQMVADAEGATKVVQVVVRGAMSDAEACRAARQVADSLLVKCSLHGGDPYWGRVVSELGAAGVAFDMERVGVSYGGVKVCDRGIAVDHDSARVATHLAGDRVELDCDLGLGEGRARTLTCDLGYGYLDENVGTS